jgi:alpha-beta hydrolase superfamily lysophospholipase
MAISKQEMLYAMANELPRFKAEGMWPAPYIYVKTWPWITPRLNGTLSKGTLRVVISPGQVEQFKSYEELVQRWMGD